MTDTARARRTNAERTADTQAALLDATVDCLVERGYANLTTREVAVRAGVSRGAQTHHYPSKNDLVVAAIERLFDVQAHRFVERYQALPEGERTLESALALLWDIVSGPTYPAVLEVIVASRTDDELRVVVHGVSARLEETFVRVLRQLFPDLGDDQLARTLVDIAFTLVQGAAVTSYAGYGDPERAISLVRTLARLVTPDTAPLVRAACEPKGSDR